MTVQSFASGALNLEKENDKFFWIRDGQQSQYFKSLEEAIHALKNHKIRWVKKNE